MLAISWNVRGLGKLEKRRMVSSLVRSHKPISLLIQESKLEAFDDRLVAILGERVLIRGVGVPAVGSVDGLLTMWNEDLLRVDSCIFNNMCILLAGFLIQQDVEIILCNVHAPNDENGR